MENLKARTLAFLAQVTPEVKARRVNPDVDPEELLELVKMCYMVGADEERTELTQWHTTTLPNTPRQVLIKCQDGNDGKVRYTVGYRTEEWNSPTLTHYDKVLGWREIAEPYEMQQDAKL